MRLSRRMFVKAGAAAGTFAIGGARAGAAPALLIYDSRLPLSLAYARGISAPKLDVAHEHPRLWRTLRDVLPAGRVVGLTRWSDLILVRGFAGEQRKRQVREVRRGQLFEWEIR